jgi:hypothetical protein
VKRPAVIVLCGAALLVAFVLRGVINPWTDRLPGIDSGNIYAWEVYTRSVLADGHLPFWNPYHFTGTPHLADPQTTVLYPPALLLRWLLPVPAYLGWMMALHLWIAGAGVIFTARVLGLGWMAASASAVAAMLGGSVPGFIHNGHLLPIYLGAWVPWAFGLAVVSVRQGRVVPDGRLVGHAPLGAPGPTCSACSAVRVRSCIPAAAHGHTRHAVRAQRRLVLPGGARGELAGQGSGHAAVSVLRRH